jgi:predicted nucleic acid-binding protein
MPAQRDLVINTGPVLALTAAGHFEILRELFARVVVPSEVVQEIEAGGRTQFAREEFRAAAWLDKRVTATILPPLLQSTLDAGEAAVIALATFRRNRDSGDRRDGWTPSRSIARTLNHGIARNLDTGEAAWVANHAASRDR